MRGLLIDSLVLGEALTDSAPLRVVVPPGGWVRIARPDADVVLDAIAGLVASTGGIVVDGRELGVLTPAARVRAGLHVVNGRVPDIPAASVLDLLLMSRRPVTGRAALRSVIGLRGRRDLDEEAEARAIAGRLGLAGWVERPAAGLPAGVRLLADAARALLAAPKAVALRAPEDLPEADAADVRETLADAQSRAGFPVLEVGHAVGSPT